MKVIRLNDKNGTNITRFTHRHHELAVWMCLLALEIPANNHNILQWRSTSRS